ncbi:MAG: sulfurtransferase TusA family protein [Bacteroidia bacterium]|nr:sulfurtransferase TusA family protein [Bacteroidia bacterium]MDW8332876.1 sulfurtransferase TusA family protein [Bacteroidia bacterium]
MTKNIVKLDCKNLNCPMPIVKIAKAFKTLAIGDSLEVTASDPAFKADLEAWVRKTGQKLESFKDGPEKVALITRVI